MSGPDTPDVTNVDAWLESLGLSDYAQSFRENNITPELLPQLSDAELRELGVSSLGHRKQLLLAISTLKRSGRTAYIPPPEPLTPPISLDLPQDSAAPAESDNWVAGDGLPAPATSSIRRAAPMPQASPLAVDIPVVQNARPWWQPRLGGKFLFVSIAAHLLFAVGATYFIVQTTQANRKITFQAGPKSPNPSRRALEHKVSLAKKQTTMSAPAQPKRIATTGASKIALPEMPALTTTDTFTPGKMSGMGGTGVGPGFGTGGMGGGGGGGLTLFGFRGAGSGGIRGELFDLKQNADGTPSGLESGGFVPAVAAVVKRGFDAKELSKYFKAPNPLYAGQIFIPDIVAEEGPKSFGVEKTVAPTMWVVVYKGKVVAPETGQFRFVGIGDDILVVKFKDRIVLDHGSYSVSGWQPKKYYAYDPSWLVPGATEWYAINRGHAVGDSFMVESGRSYDIAVLMAEHPGGAFTAQVLLEKVGATYEKDARGNPILPPFRMAKVKSPPPANLPPFQQDGPVWPGTSNASPFDR